MTSLSCLLPVVLSSMLLVNHVNFPNWGVAAMLFPYSSLCSIMLKNTVQLCQLHALAKSALGTKERRKKNNQNGYQTHYPTKKNAARYQWLILIQDQELADKSALITSVTLCEISSLSLWTPTIFQCGKCSLKSHMRITNWTMTGQSFYISLWTNSVRLKD